MVADQELQAESLSDRSAKTKMKILNYAGILVI
jgi:hypothetical protein